MNTISEKEIQIIDLYSQKTPVKEIENLLKISKSNIYRILRKNNISKHPKLATNSKYRIRTDFFEKIDSHEKAYFLGLLYADGCFTQSKTGSLAVTISLKKDDYSILEYCRSLLYIDKKPLNFSHRKRNDKFYDSLSLSIRTKKVCLDLQNLGLDKNKTRIKSTKNDLYSHMYICRHSDIVTFYQWIYKNQDAFLKRKHNKFLEFFNYKENHKYGELI